MRRNPQDADLMTLLELRPLLRMAIQQGNWDFASRISNRMLALHTEEQRLLIAAQPQFVERKRA